jgi:integrase/recombinase XerD
MAHQKVALQLRIRLGDGKRPYAHPVYTANGRLKPLTCLVNGQPEYHPEGVYTLRFREDGHIVYRSVGTDPADALTALVQQQLVLKAQAAGLMVAAPVTRRALHEPKSETPGKREIAQAAEVYLARVKKHKADKTYTAYSNTLETFQQVCRKKHLEQITADDLLEFAEARRAAGNSDRTVADRVKYILIFLAKHGIKDVLEPSDYPKYTKKKRKAYSEEQLKKLFAACDVEDFALFQFLLITGCRDEEAVHACWDNIDFQAKTFEVREHPEFNWTVKDHEERFVPVSDSLIDLLREHHREAKHRLIFPGDKGGLDHHLLRRLKSRAFLAGLNCGRCTSKSGQSCRNAAVCKGWILHRFRNTYATFHNRAGVDLPTISRWLGHADVETTMTYIDVDSGSHDTRSKVNGTFAAFVPVGNPAITPGSWPCVR